MTTDSQITTETGSVLKDVFSWFFGLVFSAIGLINVFWGNDPEYGVLIVLLSLPFYPPVGNVFHRITGYRIHVLVKIIMGLFIVWSALGVGELFDKIDLMLTDLS